MKKSCLKKYIFLFRSESDFLRKTGYMEYFFFSFCKGLTGEIDSACCATNVSTKLHVLENREDFFFWYWQLSMLLREEVWWLQEPWRATRHNLQLKTDRGTGRASLTTRSGGIPISHSRLPSPVCADHRTLFVMSHKTPIQC